MISAYDIINILNSRENNRNVISSRKLVFQNSKGLYYRIIEYCGKRGHNHTFKIKFYDTGYETIATIDDVRDGSILDYMSPSIFGKFIRGEKYKEYRQRDPELFKSLFSRWSNCIQRCYYDSEYSSYKIYGAKGVKVCDRWFTFTNYYEDVQEIDGFDRDKVINNEIYLDKDFYGSMLYSKETCIWLTAKENIHLIDFSKRDRTLNYKSIINTQGSRFIAVYPDGHEEVCLNASEFARVHGLQQAKISACLLGKRKSHKGFQFRKISNEEYEKLKK